MTALATLLACPACGARAVIERFRKTGYCYVACIECGLARLDPLPSEVEAATLYDDSYFVGGGNGGYRDYAGDEALHRLNARRRLALLGDAQPDPGQLLDIGCAHGFFLDEARRSGWRVQGVEIAHAPAEFARQRLGIAVEADLRSLAAGTFDSVTMFQVLAHTVDPAHAVADAVRLLAPGGVLVVETPDAGSRVAKLLGKHWHLATPPSIVWMFDSVALQRIMRRAGLEPGGAHRTSKSVSVGFVGTVVQQKYPRLGAPVYALATRPWLESRAVPVNLGDEMTVVGRQPGGSL